MKATFINPRNVALLVAAGLLAGTGTAIADETPAPTTSPTAAPTTPAPTTTAKPLTEYQKAREAYKAAIDAYIANRKSSQTQYKAAVETFVAAKKSYNDARKPILETFRSELAAAISCTNSLVF